MSKNSILIMVPTYNEKENAPLLAEQILKLNFPTDIWFIDDNSPDGTGQMMEEFSKKYPQIKIIHRSGKLGIGSAHFEGIKRAYQAGYKTLITMDCDFTHPPEYVPKLITEASGNDVVVGSRYLQENSLKGWNAYRKLLTKTGHFLTATLLKMPYDATGAFRLYRLDKIPHYTFDVVQSRGYSFFFESLFVLKYNGYKIKEVSMPLPPRTYGHSKMDISEIFKSVKLLFTTWLTATFNEERFKATAPLDESLIDKTKVDDQGWDDYWKAQKSAGGFLYDIVAAFYRKFIIKPNLNHFITKYLSSGANVLHAGCGSGQVDTEVRNKVQLTGLDISVNALNFYKKTNGDKCKILHGSIFDIPAKPQSYDGIYNLGVMEHFTEPQIISIFKEFHRVLKNEGKIVIFWPPEFGASVLFFKLLTFIFEKFLGKKNVKFHPDEITRVKSKKHVYDLFHQGGFEVVEYAFGPGDAFTYSIIVGQKARGLV